jgi:hypothetical protein
LAVSTRFRNTKSRAEMKIFITKVISNDSRLPSSE